MKLWFVLFFFVFSLPLFGRVINVPEEHERIQWGIYAAHDDDTVSVAPGNYFENLIISGKSITLASHFLTTGDSTYIWQTRIKSSQDEGYYGIGIYVDSCMIGYVTISGFTIQYATTGICMDNANIIIKNNIIKCNSHCSIALNHIEYTDFISKIEFNTITQNGSNGISAWYAADIENNIITNHPQDGIFYFPGLNDNYREGLKIKNNKISWNYNGLNLWNGLCYMADRDLLLKTDISYNKITYNSNSGISLDLDCVVTNNYLKGNEIGINVWPLNIMDSTSPILINNMITNSLDCGINIEGFNQTWLSEVKIINSTLINNPVAIRCSLAQPQVTNCIFYENDEIYTTSHALDCLFSAYSCYNSFELVRDEIISLSIFNIKGRLVRDMIENKKLSAGNHTVGWDGVDNSGNSVSSGIYYCILRSKGRQSAHKMVLLK